MLSNIYSGFVKSTYLCQPVKNASIKLIGQNDNVLKIINSDDNGSWSYEHNENIHYLLFEKEGYCSKKIAAANRPPELIRLIENKIVGYQNKLWYQPGKVVSAYIHSPEPFKASLLRHGLKTEKIMNIGEFDAVLQSVPDDYFTKTGLNWNETFYYEIPENAKPGIYSLEIRSLTNSQNFYRLTFLISTPQKQYGKKAKLLVLASTNNWQTYNIYGGRSRYRNFEHQNGIRLKDKVYILGVKMIPETLRSKIKNLAGNKLFVTEKENPNAFQFKELSINRPHPNCSINDDDPVTEFTSHLAPGEWRVLAWLEREKIEYDIVSGNELHFNPELLNNYNAVMLSTHCEYWSKEMYDGLENFNKSGGAILNISGNSIYREVEIYKNGNLRCISLRFQFSAKDETEVIGVRFDMRGYGTCSPYMVLEPDHWVFEGTDVSRGDIFGKSCLNKPIVNESKEFNPALPGMLTKLSGEGGSGWETDKLSQTAAPHFQLLAKGMNKKNGGSDLVIKENENEGIVFSVSSITFGGTLLIDKNASKMLLNVLQKVLAKEIVREKYYSESA